MTDKEPVNCQAATKDALLWQARVPTLEITLSGKKKAHGYISNHFLSTSCGHGTPLLRKNIELTYDDFLT